MRLAQVEWNRLPVSLEGEQREEPDALIGVKALDAAGAGDAEVGKQLIGAHRPEAGQRFEEAAYPAFVTAAQALECGVPCALAQEARARSQVGPAGLTPPSPDLAGAAWPGASLRPSGRGRAVCELAYRDGQLWETAGPHDEVVKVLPALTVGHGQLEQGLGVLVGAVASVVGAQAIAA
ncbi:hypothetical protein OHA84_01740 [Streptomyces sp. NBC_00513]|uniref:hypothetical protein n=1 Tax=Streptomyces sp. NBC_00424 TaxID=2903648 RepID=UPI00225BE772|nr:hypothetical protein [Streptomyces sp. NBC_00424]MCX5079114.1 hypothetical protein [Streptomyces sp. NBC_00424]WUD39321.1 hypothetical protein OHA84_01740 [Streptomyces sp. NBC_00513]